MVVGYHHFRKPPYVLFKERPAVNCGFHPTVFLPVDAMPPLLRVVPSLFQSYDGGHHQRTNSTKNFIANLR